METANPQAPAPRRSRQRRRTIRRTSAACKICRARNGSRASRPGWVGCSTASTCTCTRWSRRRSWRSCWRSSEKDSSVGTYSSIIQAAFLIGWALGGGFFGRIGDRMGRSRALMLTILTYAAFTGLSFFAQTWWHLLIFRFLAALGIGGEWAVGAALLSETWPRHWRPWLAAVLQTAVNIGILLASLAAYFMAGLPNRYVFLVGILPALVTLWIRRAVPETEEWHAATRGARRRTSRAFGTCFAATCARITMLTILVCSLSLTAHWAFTFWSLQHLRNLPDVADLDRQPSATQLVSQAMTLLMVSSIVGNFVAAALARRLGYRRSIALLCLTYFVSMTVTYSAPRDHTQMWYCLPLMGASSGLFALFTMYMPPLFPTLAAHDRRRLLLQHRPHRRGLRHGVLRAVQQGGRLSTRCCSTPDSCSFPRPLAALFLPEPPDERSSVAPVE